MYIYLLFIHILSAVIAIVAVISYPLIMSSTRTVEQAKFGLKLLKRSRFYQKSEVPCCLLPVLRWDFNTLIFIRSCGIGSQLPFSSSFWSSWRFCSPLALSSSFRCCSKHKVIHCLTRTGGAADALYG